MENNKNIAIMLDIGGTSSKIDDFSAKILINDLEYLRQKFGASNVIISLSTLYGSINIMNRALQVLSRNLIDNVCVGLCFYANGFYNYYNDEAKFMAWNFNGDKVATFDNYVIKDSDNVWFAVFDDTMNPNIYKRYQNEHIMLMGCPSSRESLIEVNNFMRRATVTKDIEGVIEILEDYINDIKDMSLDEILTTQVSCEKESELILKYPKQ